VHGTTIVKTSDPSVICDSVNIHHTVNHNCDDIVQLLLSPPNSQPTPNIMPELQQPPPLNLQQPPAPHEQPSQLGQLNQIERFSEDLLPSSSEQQLMEISDDTDLPSMDTAATGIGMLLPSSSSEQQLMEISDTGLPSMDTAATATYQSGIGMLLPSSSSEQQLMEISDTGLLSMNTAATVPHQSGLGTVYHRQTQRGEEKEEGHLREEKSDDEHDGVFLTEEEELQHPASIHIPQSQLNAEKNIAKNAEVVHSSPHNASFPLQVAGTTFNLSSFHFATENSSVTLYNDSKKSRLEYVDFSRPQLYLYMWDRRHAVSLSLKSPVTNRYQTRFFLAMTNLCMPLDEKGESVFEELVLLDILNRLDPYAYVDAVVGVVATGEVILWQYSLNHLRFNYCDLRHPLKRGENFWFAKLQQFYSDRGLLYLVQRLIPRDLDAPKNRFAVNKEYITHYKHNIKTMAKAEENFKKWLVLPGKNKSEREKSEDLQALLSRTNKGKSCSSDPPAQKTKAQIEQEKAAEKQRIAKEKRRATIQAKKEAVAKVQADAVEQASADLARHTTAAAAAATAATTRNPTGTSLAKADSVPKPFNKIQVFC
jgi:hypothetical protein